MMLSIKTMKFYLFSDGKQNKTTLPFLSVRGTDRHGMLVSSTRTSDEVLVGDANGTKTLAGHWFNDIPDQLFLLCSSKGLGYAILIQNIVASAAVHDA